MPGTYNDNIAYHFHAKLRFEKPVFFRGVKGFDFAYWTMRLFLIRCERERERLWKRL